MNENNDIYISFSEYSFGTVEKSEALYHIYKSPKPRKTEANTEKCQNHHQLRHQQSLHSKIIACKAVLCNNTAICNNVKKLGFKM